MSPLCSGGSSSSAGRPVAARARPRRRRGCPGRAGSDRVTWSVDRDDVRPRAREGGRGPTADERPAAPALAVLDRLEQEAGLVVAAQPGEGGDRRDQVGQQLAPDRHDACSRAASAWNSSRSGRATRRARRSGLGPEGPEEAGVVAGVAGAGALLLDHEQQRVAVAVVGGLADVLAVARGLALAPLLLAGPAPEPGAARSRASGAATRAFIQAIISTSPVPSSCTMAGTRPSASKTTAARSESVTGIGVVAGMVGHRTRPPHAPRKDLPRCPSRSALLGTVSAHIAPKPSPKRVRRGSAGDDRAGDHDLAAVRDLLPVHGEDLERGPEPATLEDRVPPRPGPSRPRNAPERARGPS